MRIVNLTPHSVTLVAGERTVTIPPSGTVARCAVERRQIGAVAVDGITVPITASVMGAVEGLPAPWRCPHCRCVACDTTCMDILSVPDDFHRHLAAGGCLDSYRHGGPGTPCTHQPAVLYIVSRVVAEAARERTDLLVPDDAVRDSEGRIIGCRALARV